MIVRFKKVSFRNNCHIKLCFVFAGMEYPNFSHNFSKGKSTQHQGKTNHFLTNV